MRWRPVFLSLMQTAQGWNALMSGAFGLVLAFFFTLRAAQGAAIPASSQWSILLYLSIMAFILSAARVLITTHAKLIDFGEQEVVPVEVDRRTALIKDARKLTKRIRLLLAKAYEEPVDPRERFIDSPALPEAERKELPGRIAKAKQDQRITKITTALSEFVPFRAPAISIRDALLEGFRVPPTGRSLYVDTQYAFPTTPMALEAIADDIDLLATKLEAEIGE